MKTWAWIAIGVGAAAVVVTGVGVAEHYAHASSVKCSVPSALTPGHRYKITVVAPPGQNLPAIPANAVAQWQADLDQQFPGSAKIVSIDPLGTNSVTLILDILPGATVAAIGNPQGVCAQFVANAPAGASLNVQDMGVSP